MLINNDNRLILICGSYKTGTSLITHLFEKAGYFNPAMNNNIKEKGKGLTRSYYTKECAKTRSINQKILSDIGNNNSYTNTISYTNLKFCFNENNIKSICEFVATLPPNSVLKDPQFTYTLYYWFEACKIIRRNLKVYFTHRPEIELIAAWNEAYFTKSLLSKNISALKNILYMQNYQKYLCKIHHIPFEEFSLERLKILEKTNQNIGLNTNNIIMPESTIITNLDDAKRISPTPLENINLFRGK